MAGFYSLASWSLNWTSKWYMWAFLVAIAGFGYLAVKSHRVSAGADWFRDQDQFVKTYELTWVEVSGYAGGWNLGLRDTQDNKIDTTLSRVQTNNELWDLVYNGIRHSVANGAQTTPDAVKRLKLWDVVRLRDERAADQ
ncbi:hypothetical protein [Amycolatopsis nigrescens]|uniref:hypothetical protein n=1 Tax=Amycolatopsis nigrescens TaxID=381445 RepID=UPI0012FCECE6|nr:hypothetical protein [Amycolatopsis nigrescens]